MAILSKDDILKIKDSRSQKVDVPEWGGEVIVSTMSGFARDQFEASILGKNGGMNTVNLRAKLVAACCVDEQGELLFKESDVIKLGKKSCTALDKIFEAAQKLNGIGEQEMEDLAKN